MLYRPNTKLIYNQPENGYPRHQKACQQHLTIGAIYTLEHEEVSGWHTDVYLVEVPNIPFNSVMFTEVK